MSSFDNADLVHPDDMLTFRMTEKMRETNDKKKDKTNVSLFMRPEDCNLKNKNGGNKLVFAVA